MNNLRNKVSLIGRLGQSPELKTTGQKNTSKYVRIPMAINENYKNKNGEWVENTNWQNLVFWGKIAELIADKAEKGQEIMIEGKLKSSVVGEGKDKRYFTDVEVSDFLVIGHKPEAKQQ
ncbi:MAG: single-stranded DNA-binding protein [Crocinitomicaceae bacterium]|jgi:single-strand DNA-binding protein|nr:single-stranded DNA-binding protein [Crocinitomicaceae bacterium]